jgi:hypothetical protein
VASEEGLAPLDDVSHNDRRPEREDEVLVVRVEDESLLDLSCATLGTGGASSYLRIRRPQRFPVAFPSCREVTD